MRAVVATEITQNRGYFDWIVARCMPKSESVVRTKLLEHLQNTEFKVRNPRDINRSGDGVALRTRYTRETGDLLDFESLSCSVLELIAALALRCEEDIMYDPDIGDRTAEWFCGMLKSLGLYSMTDNLYDEEFADYILNRFMSGQYEPNGKGGLFTLQYYPPNAPDMRLLEIWYQMHWYLREYLVKTTNTEEN